MEAIASRLEGHRLYLASKHIPKGTFINRIAPPATLRPQPNGSNGYGCGILRVVGKRIRSTFKTAQVNTLELEPRLRPKATGAGWCRGLRPPLSFRGCGAGALPEQTRRPSH